MASLICDSPPALRVDVHRELATTAWLAGEPGSAPGWLFFQDGWLSYCDCTSQVVFEARLADIERVDFPWWHWGRVCRIDFLGERYCLRFSPPFGGDLAIRVQGVGPIHGALQRLAESGAHARPSDVAAAWRGLFQAARAAR